MRKIVVSEFLTLDGSCRHRATHPLVLGKGKRLFHDGTALTRFRLVDSKPTTTGVLILTYEPDRSKPA
jgi:hypothetical protein